jgi:uncharacterized peroxidase-related enzyme
MAASRRSTKEYVMSRIHAVDPATASGKTKQLLDAVQASLGMTPNMVKTMAASPEVLEGYLSLSAALAGGRLPVALREQIAIAVAEANGCSYCLSAHSFLANKVGKLSEQVIADTRSFRSDDPKVDAVLKFARDVNERRGEVSYADIQRLREVGLTDGDVAEVLAHVALNVFTNYFNKATAVEIDFPVVTAAAA